MDRLHATCNRLSPPVRTVAPSPQFNDRLSQHLAFSSVQATHCIQIGRISFILNHLKHLSAFRNVSIGSREGLLEGPLTAETPHSTSMGKSQFWSRPCVHIQADSPTFDLKIGAPVFHIVELTNDGEVSWFSCCPSTPASSFHTSKWRGIPDMQHCPPQPVI